MRKAAAIILALTLTAVGVTVGTGIQRESQSHSVTLSGLVPLGQHGEYLTHSDTTAQFFPLEQRYTVRDRIAGGVVRTSTTLY